MNISQVYAVYFSATGNTRKVTTTLANALAVSFDVPLEVRDFTLPAAREESYEFAVGDLVVFGMPTYAGKLPNKLLDFVKSGFHGNGALAVPVVTFGNRSFDNSLAELCACLEGDGFHTIGAGAFACRHAFTDALANGMIRGAGLDVTEPEPLPAASPLWSEPKCLITPHVAGGNHLESTERRIIAIALGNVRCYANGQSLDNRMPLKG